MSVRLWAVIAVVLWTTSSLAVSAQVTVVLTGGESLSTIAGSGRDGYPAVGPAAASSLASPRGVVYDADGNLYVADSRNHQIYRVTPDGTLSVIAGTGEQGFSGDSGPATHARLNSPYAVAVRGDGTIFFSDTGNHRVCSISPAGIITTIAGTGKPGISGDGGPATTATLRRPTGIAFDASGNLLIADTGNHRIRRINPDATILTIAGTGEDGDGGDGGPASRATFQSPSALLLRPDGSILIGDHAAHRIRVFLPNATLASYAGGITLRRPEGMTTGPTGDTLLTDSVQQQLLQISTNAIGILAGDGTEGRVTTGASVTSSLDSPAGLTMATDGSLVIADRGNHQIQRLTLPLVEFGGVPAGQRSASKTLLLQNGGVSALQITGITLPPGFIDDSGGSCAPMPHTLTPGLQCAIGLVFQPSAQGNVDTIATIATNTVSFAVRFTGIALPPTTQANSQTTLSSNGSIAYAGVQVPLTAVVTGALAIPPSGSIAFLDGDTTMTSIPLASAAATYAPTSLTLGLHSLRAFYSGDSRYGSSTSSPMTVTVVPTPDFTFAAAAASYSTKTGGTMTIPLTCLPKNGTLNHPITFNVSGLPPGFSATFAPPVAVLATNAATSTLTIAIPATLATSATQNAALVVVMTCMLPFVGWTERKRRSLVVLFTVPLVGCGGGFRTAATTPVTTNRTYNVTVSATTTGVLGDTLVHSIPVELIVTP